MSSQRGFPKRTIAWAAVPILALSAAALPPGAQGSAAGYVLLVASGFLCDAGDASTCPAVVKSALGESYEMSGAGTFNPESKSVIATGTFTHRSANGNALESGIWTASELVRFNSYGIAPGELMQHGSAFGPPHFGFRRLPLLASSMPTGGLAVLRIRLVPMWGPSKNATLQVNCALGKAPREHQVGGDKAGIRGRRSGRSLLLFARPEVGAAQKAPAPKVDANPATTGVHQ